MKITENSNRDSVIVLSEGAESAGSNAFTIKTNAKMFEMLSSKIYTDKILAPIRELSCNAYDAQVEVGKGDVPIVVTLPDYKDLMFAVKDCGPGMDVDQVMIRYTTYGESGKEDSNDYIGCLGLGSKSPLCYTDQFFIETTKNGWTNKFVCYYDNGIPQIKHTSSENTEAESGTTVFFFVRESDVTTFTNKALEFFRTFEPFPEFVGTRFTTPKITKYGALVDVSYPSSNKGYSPLRCLSVRSGNVVYSVPFASFDTGARNQLESYCYSYCPTLIDVPIGSVDISVSRESLEATDKTAATVIRTLSSVRDIFIADCKKVLDANLGVLDTIERLNDIKNRAQGIRLPDNCLSYSYAADKYKECGMEDLGYYETMYLKYHSDSKQDVVRPNYFRSSVLCDLGGSAPLDCTDITVIVVTGALKSCEKYRKYASGLHSVADLCDDGTRRHQSVCIINNNKLGECFGKLGVTVLQEAEVREKLGMRVIGKSNSGSAKPKPKLDITTKDLTAVAKGWYSRSVNSWGPADLMSRTWYHVSELFDRLRKDANAEVMYIDYTSPKTALDYSTAYAKVDSGYSIELKFGENAVRFDPGVRSYDTTYTEYSARLLSLLHALCGDDHVLVLSGSALDSIPEDIRPRFVNLYERLRQVTHGETAHIAKLWRRGSFVVKDNLWYSVDNPLLTPDLFKESKNAFNYVKFLHKNYYALGDVDRAILRLFVAYPVAPEGFDMSVVDREAAKAATEMVRTKFPLLRYLTNACEDDVKNYIEAMKKFNKSNAKKGSKENE